MIHRIVLLGTLVSLAGLASLASSAAAQVVKGTLLDAESGRPATAVMVVLIDSAGERRAGALTDADGRFTIRAPHAGRYRLQPERIGFTAASSAAFRLEAGETRDEPLSVRPSPVELNAINVTVSQRRRCQTPAAGARAALVLWEEARKALNATVWTEKQAALRFQVVLFKRERDAETQRIVKEERVERSGYSRNPFRSLSPDALTAGGYIQHDGRTYVYYAPSAETLLSPTFVERHCFFPVAGEGGLIGLGFSPARSGGAGDPATIEGVLWLDRQSSELRYLEYRYVRLPFDVHAPQAGGRVEFERLPDGGWIIASWRIQMPGVGERSIRYGDTSGRRLSVTAIHEEAGEVLAVSSLGGARIRHGASATLVGTVMDSTRSLPLADAEVFLVGTGYRTRTDSRGRFVLAGLPADQYRVAFQHPRLDSLGARAPERQITLVPGTSHTVGLAVPSLGSVRTASCPSRREGTGSLYGIVRNRATLLPLPGARVALVDPSGSAPLESTTDGQGRYLFCEIPIGTAFTPQVTFLGETATLPAVRMDGSERREHDLAIRSYTVVARTTSGSEFGAVFQPVQVRGRVVDAATGEPLSGASIRIHGQERRTHSDGTFLFGAVRPGVYRVEVRHTNFRPHAEDFSFGGGGSIELVLRLQPI